MVGDDGGQNRIGIAPGAEWIGCRNMDEGVGTPASYIECFEFFLAPYPVGGTPEEGDPGLAPDVVNNSWSCPSEEGCDPGTLEAAVSALRSAGIMVVVSTGNSGPACGSVVNPPAIYQQSLSVGAFSHSTEEIANFSSRGPVTYAGQAYVKPNITAPGVSIRSSVPGSGYGYSSGTSMAAPHVAGAVGLVLSAVPGYNTKVGALEAILTRSAQARPDSQCGDPGPRNNVWGWGILDALAAVQRARSASLQGAVTDARTGAPLAGARVATELPGGTAGPEAQTDGNGRYTMSLAAGTYNVTASAAGYRAKTVSGFEATPTSALDFELELLDPTDTTRASFTGNSPVCLGQPLVLTNTSTPASRWFWDFGDDTTSTEWQPAHTYAGPGQYEVTLVITDDMASDAFSDMVTVEPPPTAAFRWTAQNLTVTFLNDSQDADTYLWSFGDGLTSTLVAPVHAYILSDTYPVSLTASSTCGQDFYRQAVSISGWRLMLSPIFHDRPVSPQAPK
jgi:PKD repeat protein